MDLSLHSTIGIKGVVFLIGSDLRLFSDCIIISLALVVGRRDGKINYQQDNYQLAHSGSDRE